MSLFTIEQVELIRRLRKSGVSQWQVIDAFDQLERLEMECHPATTVVTPTPPPPPASATSPLPSSAALQQSTFGQRPVHHRLHSGSPMPSPASVSLLVQYPPRSSPHAMPALTSQNSSSTQSSPAAASCQPMGQVRYPPIAPRQCRGAGYTSNLTNNDVHGKSLLQGKRDFSNGTNAELQESISLQALPEEISNLQSSTMAAAAASVKTHPWHHVKSRFIFRKGHLLTLEEEFKRNQYPDAEQRREIAEICNCAYPNSSSRVTPMVVLNWFSNKRKAVRNHLKGREITGSCRELVERVLQDISPSAAHYLFQGAAGCTTVSGSSSATQRMTPQNDIDSAQTVFPSHGASAGTTPGDCKFLDSPGGTSFESDLSSSEADSGMMAVCKQEMV